MTIITTEIREIQINEAHQQVYQTTHSLFYIELDRPAQYTPEELAIEGV